MAEQCVNYRLADLTLSKTVTRRLISVAQVRIRHGHGRAITGHFSDLMFAHPVFQQLAADGIGAIGGNLPIAIVLADGGSPLSVWPSNSMDKLL